MKGLIHVLIATSGKTDPAKLSNKLPGKKTISFKRALNKREFICILEQTKPQAVLFDETITWLKIETALRIIRSLSPTPAFFILSDKESSTRGFYFSDGADGYILKNKIKDLPGLITLALKKKTAETKRQRQRAVAMVNKEKYSSLIENMGEGVIALSDDWRITYINKTAEGLLKPANGSVIGKNIWKEFPKAVGNEFYEGYHKTMQSRKSTHVESYSDVMKKWILATIHPSVNGIIVYFEDITVQRYAELQAKQSEEKYQMLIERITDGFIALDKDFRYIYANKKIGELTGKDPEWLIGKNVWEVFPEAVGTPTYKAFLKAMKEQVPLANSDYFEPLDLWQENYIYPSPGGISVFIRDITQRMKAEKQLRSAHERLLFHIENAPLGFIEWDEKIKPRLWSKRAEKIFGWTEREAISRLDWLSRVYEEDLPWVGKVAEKMITGEIERTSLQHRNYTRDGRVIWCEWFNSALKDENGKVVTIMSLVRDITEQKKAEEDIHSMEQQIADQKIQEQKRITRAVLSGQEKERNRIGQELHDNINQILAGTKLHLSLAAKDDEIKKLLIYPIELIDQAIQEIRILSTRNVTPLKNVDLRELIHSLLEEMSFNRTIKTSLTYKISDKRLSDDLKLNIYRIVQEQINNIVKHSAAKSVEILLTADHHVIHLFIIDDGKGFDVTKKRKGIGISNMITRIQSFDGIVTIDSLPGKGSRIEATIPYE